MEKDAFYDKMKIYFDNGIIREIYSSDYMCILSLGEVFYIACPYVLINDSPIGIYVPNQYMKVHVNDNKLVYSMLKAISKNVEKNKNIIFDFPPDGLDKYREYIETNKKINCNIDYKLEEEIIQMGKKGC